MRESPSCSWCSSTCTMFRMPLFPFVLLLFAACDRNALKERVNAIHERNAKQDQVSRIRVMHEVRK